MALALVFYAEKKNNPSNVYLKRVKNRSNMEVIIDVIDINSNLSLESHEIVMYILPILEVWSESSYIVRRSLNLKFLSNIKTKREIFKNNFGLLRISELYLPAINVHLLFLVIIESFWFGSSYLGNLDIQPHRHLALKWIWEKKKGLANTKKMLVLLPLKVRALFKLPTYTLPETEKKDTH